jgi:hypothetical protein
VSKKHAKKKDLDYLKAFTDDRLISRGLKASPETSVIDRIRATAGYPMLPGQLQEYLPTPILINLGRRALLDMGREWQLETKQEMFKQNKLDEFFKFVVGRLNIENYVFQKIMNERAKEINEMEVKGISAESKTLAQWLKPQDVKDMVNALSVFMVDSFAVAIASRSASETTEFLEWFLNWSQKLLSYWPADIRSHGASPYSAAKSVQKQKKA